MFTRRKEAKLAARLDKLLAGEHIAMPAGLLEEKLWQVLRTLEAAEQRSKTEHDSVLHLMSDVSHQLKTPLASLNLYLDLASDMAHTAAERETFLIECKKQTDKISWLTDALFKMARLESGLITVKKSLSDLVKTIRGALDAVSAQADAKQLTITANLPVTLELEHDPLWTKEALSNILDNAIKYTDRGGITITAEQGPIYTRIDISDTGIGMAQEEYTKIFARFYRVRDNNPRAIGTGLGLTIAREILRQQSGNITVASEVGKGSTFSVFLQNC